MFGDEESKRTLVAPLDHVVEVVSRLQPFPAIKWPLRLHFLVLQEHLDTQAHSCAGCASTSHLRRALLTDLWKAVREQCSPLWCQGTNFHHFQCNFWISMARILKCWSALWITSKTWRMRTRPWGLWTLDAQVECPSDELRAEADSFPSSWHFENQSFCIFRSVNVVVKHATSLWWGQSSQSSWITFVICCACVPPCWQQLGWSLF